MTTARASHLRLVVTEPVAPVVRQPRLRFRPVVRLADGEAFGLHAEADISFEDTFQPRHLSDATLPSAAGWLGDLIERAGRLAQETGAHHRPLSISAPMAALADKDAPMAAEAGAARAGILTHRCRRSKTSHWTGSMHSAAAGSALASTPANPGARRWAPAPA
jgi:hypothetical protein